MTDSWLPLLAAALLPALVLDRLLTRLASRWLAPRWRAALVALFLAATLVPVGGLSLSGNIRGLSGDLSVGTMAMMAFYFGRSFGPQSLRRFDRELPYLAAVVVLVAAFFYPMSLGLTLIDPYAHGYYPTVLSALLMTFFCWAVLGRWYLSATLLALAYAGYAAHLLESSNLWDYLFDPILVAAAIVCVAIRGRELLAAPWRSLFPQRFTVGALTLVAVFLAFSVVLARADPDGFANDFTVEDGFIEWGTAIALFAAFLFSVHRFFKARRLFGYRGQAILLLVAAVSLFGGGEEISWGQRVFDIETPASLKAHNAQKEMNLHNLTFEWNGKEIKVNKLVFGRALSFALLLYLFVLTPLYHRNARLRRLVDAWAIPIPAALHVAAYVAVIAVVELLIHSEKRGEMTEFSGAIVFMLNVVYAANRHIYDPGRRNGESPQGVAAPRAGAGGT